MALEQSDADMYGDNSTLTDQAKTVPELEQKLAAHAHKEFDLWTENRMAANENITNVMLITTWQKEPHSQRGKEY